MNTYWEKMEQKSSFGITTYQAIHQKRDLEVLKKDKYRDIVDLTSRMELTTSEIVFILFD